MSLKNIILTVIVIIVAAAIIYSIRQESENPLDKMDLKLRLKAGESHEMKITSSYDIIKTINNKLYKSGVKSEVIIGLDVKSVDANGIMAAEFFYKAIKLQTSDPNRSIDFDSTNLQPAEPNDLLQQAITIISCATIDSRFGINISPTGQTSDITDLEKIKERVEEKLKDTRPVMDINSLIGKDEKAVIQFEEAMAASKRYYMIAGLCKQMLNSVVNETREMTGFIIIKYPDNPLSVGSKWQNISKLYPGFWTDANTTYTLKRHENGCAYINMFSDVDMKKKLKLIEVNSYGRILKYMSGVRKASNVVDETTGLLQKSDAVMKFSGLEQMEPDKLSLPLNSIMKIPTVLEGNMVIELIK